MKKILVLMILLIGLKITAQTTFEKGFFIMIGGDRVDCLILNENLLNAPTDFKYKLSEESEIKIISASQLQSLLIKSSLKFERHMVKIDKSSSFTSELESSRFSEFQDENLLLNVLVDGKVSLLNYSTGSYNRFFYKMNGKVVPLEYKLYKTKSNTIGKNLNYQKQLRDLPHYQIKMNSKIRYSGSSLVNFFVNYNSFNNFTFTDYTHSSQRKKGKIYLRAKLSAGLSNFKNNDARKVKAFDTKLTNKIGLDFEYIIPFNNYKWSLFAEPTFQPKFSTESKFIDRNVVVPSSGEPVYSTATINYSAFEVPLGIRHYFSKNSLFLNMGLNINSLLNSNITGVKTRVLVDRDPIIITKIEYDSKLKSRISFFLGFGYLWRNKINIECRYNNTQLLNLEARGADLDYFDYNNVSLKLGYNFF